MNILEKAKSDAKTIITGGWSSNMSIRTPDSSNTAEVKCLHTVHNNSLDGDGFAINSKKVSVVVYEKDLIDLSYPTRDGLGHVNMHDHIVSVSDFKGIPIEYSVSEMMPDDTLGLLTLILVEYSNT